MLGLLCLIKLPLVLAITVSLRIAWFTVFIYAGCDYIGYKQADSLDITKGVAQVVQISLGVEARVDTTIDSLYDPGLLTHRGHDYLMVG